MRSMNNINNLLRHNQSIMIHSKEEWQVILQNDYVDKKKSTLTIAKEQHCSAFVVGRWLKKCDIRTRGTAETQRGVKKKDKHKTCEAQLIRTSTKYVEWRLAVYQRDSFKCVGCGDAQGGNLQAHHILHFASHLEARFDVSNGTTLCKKCHGKIHIHNFIHVA